MNRQELEAAAHAKWERDNLVKQAEAKWSQENPVDPTEELMKENFKPSKLQSFGVGGLQGMLFNFGDEALGRLSALGEIAATDKTLKDYDELVKRETEVARSAFGRAKKENPMSHLGGEVTSMAAQSMIPALNAAKGTNLARATKAATMGAASGVGDSTADNFVDLSTDAGYGAAGGLLGMGIDKGLGKATDKTVKAAKLAAENLAEMVPGVTKAAREKFKPGTGRALLDQGLIKFGDTAKKFGDRAKGLLDETGEEIGSILQGLDKAGAKGIKRSDIIAALDQRIESLSGEASTKPLANKLAAIKKEFEEIAGDYTLGRANQQKSKWASQAKYDRRAGQIDSAEAAKETAGLLRKLVKDGAESADPFQAQAIEQLNEKFGLLKPIVNGLKKPQTPAIGGVGDLGAGIIGLLSGSTPEEKAAGMASAMLAKRMLIPRASSMGAVGLDRLAKGLLKSNNLTNILPTARTGAGFLKREEKKKD